MDKVSAQAMQIAQAYDAMISLKAGDASGTANNQWMHGMTGMLNTYGLNRDVFNTMVLPKLGLLARLPVTGTNEMRPLVGFLTGQKALTGTKQPDNCSPCQVAGDLKTGKITSVFGKTCLSTKTFDLSSELGAVKNRGEFTDFRLIGGSDPSFSKAAPTVPGGMSNILNRELDAELFKLYVAWGRDVWARLLYEGNPSNNTGSYQEFRGLDTLINTGYQDAETGAYLPSADATVQPVNYNIRTNGQAFVELLTYDMRRAKSLASKTGMDPVQYAYVMPEMLFYELTAIWPCSYLTNRCSNENTTLTMNVDANEQRRMVDEMRTGNYLLLDGVRYEVILDDTIRETAGAGGEFSSSIYRVPLRVVGSIPALYVEYYDFDNQDARDMRSAMSAGDEIMTSDGGRWIWNRRKNGFCVSMDATERSRVRLDTPFLATRFTGVKYTPLQLTRSGFPGDGNRFYNGGNTVGIAPSLYPPTVYTA